jgi:hypothetical protein
MVWRVPGVDHLARGVDAFTGEERIAPLFLLGHCTSGDPKLIQDVYRDLVYTVPDQLYVQPYPQCTYSTTTTSFASSKDMSKSLAAKSGAHAPDYDSSLDHNVNNYNNRFRLVRSS